MKTFQSEGRTLITLFVDPLLQHNFAAHPILSLSFDHFDTYHYRVLQNHNPVSHASAMASPAVNIALIILCVFVLIVLVAWFYQTQINTFVRALLTYRRRDEHRSQSSRTKSGEA